jgi:hypothetical protein
MPVCARDNDLWPPAGAPHFHHVGADALPDPVSLTGHLLAAGHRCFCTPQVQRDRVRGDVGHHAVDQFAFSVCIAGKERVALCLTDALQDHLLGRLCGNATKRGGRDVPFDQLAKLDLCVNPAGLCQRAFKAIILDHFDDHTVQKDARRAGLAIDHRLDILPTPIVFPVGRNQCRLDCLKDHLLREAALAAYLVDGHCKFALQFSDPPASTETALPWRIAALRAAPSAVRYPSGPLT